MFVASLLKDPKNQAAIGKSKLNPDLALDRFVFISAITLSCFFDKDGVIGIVLGFGAI